MNLVDIVIVGLALLAAIDGYRRGAALTAGQYLGLFAGLILGATLAPHVIDHFDVTRLASRALIAVLVVFAGAGIGMAIGTAVSSPIRRVFSQFALTSVLDGAIGVVISVVVVLAAALTLARSLALGPNYAVASAVQQSTVVRKLNELAPVQPAFLTRFEQVLSQAFGSGVFTGLEPSLPSPLSVDPGSASTATARAAAAAVVKVEGQGCGGTLSGSGFPVGAHEIITNAHVVAGTRQTSVRLPGSGQLLPAQVILFDPDSDIAVLRVPDMDATPFTFGTAARGTKGVIIGYPDGGPERIASGVVNGPMTAHGFDIYNSASVTRDVLALEGDIEPGNSGGPFVDSTGHVVGMVFARSLSHHGEGFALATSELQPDLDSLTSGSPVFDAGRFRCAG